ncbi:MAG: M20 family metallopeptidase [Mycobacteriaceae bacterium]|uniref:M20 family metallopeptidase n=1 Tax=Corynebacterium sp. TaxID=1720 RepID=UPI003F964BD3
MTDSPSQIRDLSAPLPPSPHFPAQLQEASDAAKATVRHPGSPYPGAPEELQVRLGQHIDAARDDLVDLMVDLGEHPETAFREHRSAAAVADLLDRLTPDGITATVGVHGLDTAIRAELPALPTAAPDAPVTAVLAEYDALPEIGHGCGHNVIAAMGLGAFIGLAKLREETPEAVPSRVVFLGTPAEEGHTGKEYMAQEGAFDGIDIAVMAHGYGDDVADQLWLGRRTLTVEFHGHSAHASAQPFSARNALDAASLMYQGIGLLRQQTPPTDRIHAIINSGGQRASVIPDHAEVTMYVRSPAPETLRDLSHRVEDVAHGAALMAGVGVTIHWDDHPPSLPVRTNQALTGRWVEAERRRGRDPYPRGVVSETLAASTDFGNVSYRLPGIHPLIKVSDSSVALHTRDFAAATFTGAGRAAVVDGAYGLAATLLDVQHDPRLAADVVAEFQAAGGALDVARYFS